MRGRIAGACLLLLMLLLPAGLAEWAIAGPDVPAEPAAVDLPDGEYDVEVGLIGGGGRLSPASPAGLTVRAGRAWARLEWPEAGCEALRAAGGRYLPGTDGAFEIPVTGLDVPVAVAVERGGQDAPCLIMFYADTLCQGTLPPWEAARRVLWVSLAIIVGGGAMNYLLKRRR